MRPEKRYNLWVDSYIGSNHLVLENEVIERILAYMAEYGLHKDICNLEEVVENESN